MKKKIKKQKTLYSVFGIIADIFVYPIILISFVSSFFMLVSKSQNLVPPVFGNYFVRILSGSMAASGFYKGDIVIVGNVNVEDIRKNDVIAFYYYFDPVDESSKNAMYGKDEEGNEVYRSQVYQDIKNMEYNETKYIEELQTNFTKKEVNGRITIPEIAEKETPIYFHQVIDIFIDESGTLFFRTKGTSNGSPDSTLVRADMVVGRYVDTPRWIRDTISFCSSGLGMLIIVVIPISIVVLLELLSLLEQISNLLCEKKVIKRELPFDDKDVIKANVGIEMRDYDKAYYYDVMPNQYKEQVFEFLWGHLETSGTQKQRNVLFIAKEAVKHYDFENPENYYKVWIDSQLRDFQKSKYMGAQKLSEETKYNKTVVRTYQNYKTEEVPEIQNDTIKTPTAETNIKPEQEKTTNSQGLEKQVDAIKATKPKAPPKPPVKKSAPDNEKGQKTPPKKAPPKKAPPKN